MAPGLPSDPPSDTSAAPSSTSSSKLSLPLAASPAPPPLRLEEAWEDVRDALADSELFQTLSQRVRRARVAASTAARLGRQAAWVLATTALVLVVPLLYEIDRELGPAEGMSAPPASSASAGGAAETPAASSATASESVTS